MKGALALEYVVRLIILLVFTAVMIGIIFYFSDEIKFQVGRLFKEETVVKTQEIERDSFSTSQVRNYIKSCWLMTGEHYDEDVYCYILKGDLTGVDEAALGVEGVTVEVNADFSKGILMIKFEDIGDKILVEN